MFHCLRRGEKVLGANPLKILYLNSTNHVTTCLVAVVCCLGWPGWYIRWGLGIGHNSGFVCFSSLSIIVEHFFIVYLRL